MQTSEAPPASALDDAAVAAIQTDLDHMRSAISGQIYGKDDVISRVLAALAAGGHVLIEDVPGVGKTTLASSVAQAMGGSHNRIQFTSDLLPSDIVGVPIYRQSEERFTFREGPLFANVVLADEINRTTPKTQSALLEAMQDHKVSVDGTAYALPEPFIVLATQNPVEHRGTYPLPESQLDRFMLRIRIGYPDRDAEAAILGSEVQRRDATVNTVITADRVREIQALAPSVRVDESLVKYILDLTDATRSDEDIELGVSTRGALMLHRAAQATALCAGRAYCIPDDVKQLASPVLAHRITVRASMHQGLVHTDTISTAELVIDRILARTEAPH